MRINFRILLGFLLLGTSCSHLSFSNKQKINIDNFELELQNHKSSLPGTFLLAPSDHSKIHAVPAKSYLVAIDTSGNIRFQRSFENLFHEFAVMEFKKIETGLYGYFQCFTGSLTNGAASYHFLDQNFHDVFPRPVPDADPNLDPHDVLVAPNGNYFFIFYRPRLKEAALDIEIQEWTAKGEVVFSWRSQDHLLPLEMHAKLIDPFHINSIDYDTDGGLLLSIQVPSVIMKIEHPSGKIMWAMSPRSWSFPNDPYGGFWHQHAVRRLKNGNLLFFDNGDIYKPKPSRAVEYQIDEKKKEAKLVWEYRAKGNNTFRQIGGSVQRLSNGNTLIGWGSPPEPIDIVGQSVLFTEVDRMGNVARELIAKQPLTSYRVFFEEAGLENNSSPARTE